MNLRYPFDAAAVWPITQTFGANPDDYARWGLAGHNGIDYGAPTGTPVLAAAGGFVERADFDEDGYGWYVEILHSGFTTIYAHLSEIRVQRGSAVYAGGMIGKVGSSGNSTGPHLHFEVRQVGQERNSYGGAIDPAPLLQADGRGPAVVYVVKVGELNIRNQAGIGGTIVGKARLGDELQIVKTVTPEVWGQTADGRWLALEYQGQTLAAKKNPGG